MRKKSWGSEQENDRNGVTLRTGETVRSAGEVKLVVGAVPVLACRLPVPNGVKVDRGLAGLASLGGIGWLSGTGWLVGSFLVCQVPAEKAENTKEDLQGPLMYNCI